MLTRHERVLARALAILAVLLASACTKNEPRCFECGLTDEWARAAREESERSIREDRETQARLRAAITAGNDEQFVFDTIIGNESRYQELIVAELEGGRSAQPALLLDWIYDYLVRYPDTDPQQQQVRERIFVLVAVSRGEAARPLLETCAATALAPRCAEALAQIASTSTSTSTSIGPESPATPTK